MLPIKNDLEKAVLKTALEIYIEGLVKPGEDDGFDETAKALTQAAEGLLYSLSLVKLK